VFLVASFLVIELWVRKSPERMGLFLRVPGMTWVPGEGAKGPGTEGLGPVAGRAIQRLAGVYVYGDFDTGRIWGLRERDGQAVSNGELVDLKRNPKLSIAAFGDPPGMMNAFNGSSSLSHSSMACSRARMR